jgi:hypothetical protein
VSTENSKDEVILGRCAISRPATAFFRIILKKEVKVDGNGADAKSTKCFELFEWRNLGTVRVSTENSKDEVILSRCAISRPATDLFRV